MAEKLDIIVSLKDQASAGLETFESRLKKVGDAAQKIGAGMAVVGGVVVAGAAVSIKAYQKQEKAEARLEQIATKVTGATGEQIAGFKTLASDLQKVGVVGDEVLISGQSQLASFTKSSAVVTELSDDLADLAVAQYGTDVSQEQSIQTANLLGKALGGQLGALTRTGILVNDDLKAAFEAANTEQERAAVISKIVQDNYGGLNVAMRDTSEGGLQALKNSFGDMQEMLGAALIPMLTTLVEKITPIVDRAMEWITANQELVDKITPIVVIIGALMLVLAPLLILMPGIIALVGALGTVMGFVSLPILLVVAAVVALIAIGVLLWKNWDNIKQFFLDAWTSMGDKVNEVVSAIRNYIESNFGWLIEWFGAWWSLFTSIFNLGIAMFQLALEAFGQHIIDFFKLMWTIMGEFLKGALGLLKTMLDIGLSALELAWKNFWGAFGSPFKAAWEGIKAGIKAGINWIIEKINYFVRKANEIARKANIIPGVNIQQFPEIPMLAQGGIVTKPTMAMIGEGGESEAVVPLSKANQMGFGGGGMTININISDSVLTREDQVVELVGDPLMKVFKQHFAVV